MTFTVGDMFAGIGGIALGFKQAGIEVKWSNEFDVSAQKTYLSNFDHKLYSGDVKELDPTKLPYVDIVTAGFPCFKEDALILTLEHGYLPINKINIGDHVLTHKCRWRKVLRVMCKLNTEVFKFRSSMCPSLYVTSDHPLLTKERYYRWNNSKRSYYRSFLKDTWKPINTLTKNDFVCTASPKSIGILDKTTPEFWLLVGRYLADGWRVERKNRKVGGRVVIRCSFTERDELSDIITKAGYNYTLVKDRTCYKFHIINNKLYYFLEPFGKLAQNKTVPGFVFCMDRKLQTAFLNGYLSGDGYISKSGVIGFSTTSEKLSYSMALLMQMCYNRAPNMWYHKTSEATIIEGRVVKQRPIYIVRVHSNNTKNFVEEDYGWYLNKGVTKTNEYCTVWNIEVEEDNSYMVNNTVVHNCQAFSIAGYQKGFEDDRGELFFDIIRFINTLKPKVFFLENVKNLKAHDNGNTFKIIEETMKSVGYSFNWAILSAFRHGNIPQNRDRIYMVGFRNDLGINTFVFPEEVPLTTKIGDLLEQTQVPSKYYFKEDHKYMPLLKEAMVSTETMYQWRRIYVRENKNKLCPTLTANMGAGGHNVPLIVDAYGFRRLTPRECFRFQGFPESFILPEGMADSALYKQAGNSVTVPVIKRIAESIKQTLEKGFIA